jgi:hypothetical protein
LYFNSLHIWHGACEERVGRVASIASRTSSKENIMKDLHSVIGVYDSRGAAESAVREIEKGGFDIKRLSIIGKGYQTDDRPMGFYTTGDRMKSWGGFGAFWGGLWGILFGGAFFWVPGLGVLGRRRADRAPAGGRPGKRGCHPRAPQPGRGGRLTTRGTAGANRYPLAGALP